MRGGVSVVQGEVSQLLSAMRKAGRWSGHVRTVRRAGGLHVGGSCVCLVKSR